MPDLYYKLVYILLKNMFIVLDLSLFHNKIISIKLCKQKIFLVSIWINFIVIFNINILKIDKASLIFNCKRQQS